MLAGMELVERTKSMPYHGTCIQSSTSHIRAARHGRGLLIKKVGTWQQPNLLLRCPFASRESDDWCAMNANIQLSLVRKCKREVNKQPDNRSMGRGTTSVRDTFILGTEGTISRVSFWIAVLTCDALFAFEGKFGRRCLSLASPPRDLKWRPLLLVQCGGGREKNRR